MKTFKNLKNIVGITHSSTCGDVPFFAESIDSAPDSMMVYWADGLSGIGHVTELTENPKSTVICVNLSEAEALAWKLKNIK